MNAHPIKSAALSTLRASPRNVRTHSKRQIRQIADSIERFGFTSPVVVDDSGTILAGHGRAAAATLLEFQEIPVLVLSGLTEAERRAFALADNKIASNAGWDRDLLAIELAELLPALPELGLTIDITGFDAAEIDLLQHDRVDSEIEPSDDIPVLQAVSVSNLGDQWVLGKHRLFCGDARSSDAWQTLMGDDKATMCFSDPPYNVRISGVQGRGKIKHREFAEASGEMSKAEFIAFLQATLGMATQFSNDGAIHYVCMDWRHLGEMQAAVDAIYTELKNLIVWNKTNAGQGSFYRSQHELIFVCKVGSAEHINNFGLGKNGRNRSNVWTYAGANSFRSGRIADLSMHPTVKPVALVADAMRDCSRRGDIVVDPFIGSGTTILAAERVGRRAFGIELDPLYVDVALRRWQTYTKKDAVLAGTSQTFDEVAVDRQGAAERSKP